MSLFKLPVANGFAAAFAAGAAIFGEATGAGTLARWRALEGVGLGVTMMSELKRSEPMLM